MTERFEVLRPREGLVVFHESSRRRLAQDGERVRITSYWTHLINDADRPVEIVSISSAGEPASAPSKAAKSAKETP